MPGFLLYLLLSLGSGAAYALLANGIVAMYKGSGILNFAQGGVAMFSTYCYMALVDHGVTKYVAIVLVMIGAAVFGAILSYVVFRPIRTAPALAKVVVTLGIVVALQGLAVVIWGSSSKLVPSLFPTNSVSVGGDAHLGVDRLWMFGVAVLIAALLAAGYRFTRLGLATQATSENERGASLLGYSPTVISSLNWALGSALAALAGALIAPITTLDTATMPLLVLPALAAALAGRFSSFGITTAAAFGIGWAQSTLLHVWTQPGVQTAAPFVIVIFIMVVAGRALPTRGAVVEGRPPRAPIGRNRWLWLVVGVAVAIVALATFNPTYQTAMATSLTTAILCLSIVVVTGYVGQISLMQLTFAGLGGFITAKAATSWGIPFPLTVVVGALLAAPLGAVLGAPALRVRGLALAVVTLGAAVAVDAVLFQNQGWTGGLDGEPVPEPHLWGFSLEPFGHPVRYGAFCLVALVLMGIMVGNLRKSGAGRRMLAVRSNERAAAVAGVNVAAVKLQAFTLSSFIAALAGGCLAYSNSFIVFGGGQFAAMPSITLVTTAYIGGIASVSGAMLGGFIASGGVLYVLLSGIGGFDNWYLVVSGVGLVLTVILQPDGVVIKMQDDFHNMVRRVRGWTSKKDDSETPAGEPPAITEEAPGAVRVP